jgi:hypothetical protein
MAKKKTKTDPKAAFLAAIDKLLTAYRKWEPGEDGEGTGATNKALWAAVDAATTAMPHIDLGKDAMALHEAYIAFTVEQQAFDDRTDGRNIPDSFWTALGVVSDAQKSLGKKPKSMRPPESVATFVSQDVGHDIIARNWGLYDEDGKPDLSLVQKEISDPGSVINDKYVHPNDVKMEAELEERHARYVLSLETLDKPVGPRKPCKETPEELFRTGVLAEQAANMLMQPTEKVDKQWTEFAKTITPDTVPVTGGDRQPRPEYVPTGGPMARVDQIIEDKREEETTVETDELVSAYAIMDDEKLLELAVSEGIEATDRDGIIAELDALDEAKTEEVA